MVKVALGNLLNLIYPPFCLICRQDTRRARHNALCDACCCKIELYANARVFLQDEEKLYIRNIFAVCRYDGVLRDCLHLFKYNGKLGLAAPLAGLMIDFLKSSNEFKIGDYDSIVPVPLEGARAREREFNQAEVLAGYIAREFARPLAVGNLKRIRQTRRQSELTKTERKANVKGAFCVKDTTQFSEKTILLIDDLLTTGATLNECATTLLAAGVSAVDALVLAKG